MALPGAKLAFRGLVAQWIERLRPKEGVGGSIPSEAARLLNLKSLIQPISSLHGRALWKPALVLVNAQGSCPVGLPWAKSKMEQL